MALAVCTLGAANPVAARDRPTSTASKVAAQDAATLARLIYPEALNSAIVTYTIVHVVTPAYHADPNLRTLEADHPGIIDAMIAAMAPEFERGRRDALPRLWAETATVYATGLTPDQLRQAIAFYTSPAGRRLTRAQQRAMAHASADADRAGAQQGWTAGVTADDAQARSVFDATAAGRALAAAQPRIAAIITAWNNARTPEADDRVGKAMSKAADRFYGSAPEPIRLVPIPSREQTGRKPGEQ